VTFSEPQLDSAFQLQEHLAALHYYHTANNTVSITRESAALLASPPPGTDRTLWLYELCRFLIAHCNSLIVGFLFDTPPCSAATCPEMRASEWQFLCAVHESPKSCCAIDYCCHTLDWAANVVTNPKIFPSRFVLADAAGHDKGAAVKNLVNVFRRLHRIFAHAWFQHRGVFWSVEGQTGLYVFFKTVCDLYELLPAENYKLPPEAEGLEAPTPSDASAPAADRKSTAASGMRILQQTSQDEEHLQPVGRTSTSRHIKRPSTGRAVATVPERDEDESAPEADVANRLSALHISVPPETVEEEGDEDMAEVPVIVEQGVVGESREASQPAVEARDEEPEDEPTLDEGPAGPPSAAPEEETAAGSQETELPTSVDGPGPEKPVQPTPAAAEEAEDEEIENDDTLLPTEPEHGASEAEDEKLPDVSVHDYAQEKAEEKAEEPDVEGEKEIKREAVEVDGSEEDEAKGPSKEAAKPAKEGD